MSDYKEIPTGKDCRACGGPIVTRTEIPYYPVVRADLIGPGSRNVATEKDRVYKGYHCDTCGIEYHKLPKG